MNKTYLVTVNFGVDAPVWWEAAREAEDLPDALHPLVLGTALQVEITHDDLCWCKTLPHWDGLDGWPLRVTRLS